MTDLDATRVDSESASASELPQPIAASPFAEVHRQAAADKFDLAIAHIHMLKSCMRVCPDRDDAFVSIVSSLWASLDQAGQAVERFRKVRGIVECEGRA